ncbi:MAG: hypothetical protein IKU26_06595 [Clostridia bacterium]|nr:hypothetical protein [Clostridia bacterium]
MLSQAYHFTAAKPVWAKDRSREMNVNLLFAGTLPKMPKATLAITAACSYVAYLNGAFLCAGPARTAHGFFRVDEISLDGHLTKDNNVLEIKSLGAYLDSYQHLRQPSFLCAEVVSAGNVVLRTDVAGENIFKCTLITERIQKTHRFSIQRTIAEVYDYTRDAHTPVVLELGEGGTFITRNIPYPDFSVVPAKHVLASGQVIHTDKAPTYVDFVANLPPEFKAFDFAEFEACSVWDAQKLEFRPNRLERTEYDGNPLTFAKDSYALFDLGCEKTGMIGLTVTCQEPTTIYALFDEILQEDPANPLNYVRMATTAVVRWHLPAGTHQLLSYEPYSFRYLQLCVVDGACTVENVHLRNYSFGPIASKTFQDPALQKIYDAAIETFRQNVVDIYMDCPSRERAGWLCDSYFTSRVERVLTGKSEVERNFLENFLLPDGFENLPAGMLPMCYPANFRDGNFIPNWAMWYVLELEEYLARTGDQALIDLAKDRMYALLHYFKGFENEYGLLENLERWVFVEWSKANDLVQDVNFPSNFLYAAMKKVMGRLYQDDALLREGEALLETARAWSLSGEGVFFCDNAVRENGKLVLSGECTEVCQYYAFYFGAATPEANPELFRILTEDFGPQRKQTGAYPEIYFANAFIGNYLRLDLLQRWGMKEKLIEEIKGYFTFMAERTGTLWEHDNISASCNHGFASHIICWLTEAL